ncbi:S41 family peptidase [Aliiglaciecola sp. CAU 1673]|uniref:S41 family peptidase n=1 Tax=Aliiglaciecola sp. CAU 1673 TaxID=3032595 RepID=UPI0023DCE45E|nr:S41 family peptidase [Aliiglaciecola sp. CAU 1673]MDF2177984.1 S41 family peptidase [Aliiglaciecola sp. CAU 1673]
MLNPVKSRFCIVFVAFVMLTACGGGGSSSSPAPIITPTNPGNTDVVSWQAGVYPSSENLKDFCQAPRAGIDPFEQQPYPDKTGSALQEKLWLRSWSHESYLWYQELPDINPANYNVQDYFELLRTDALTDSGNAKDNFHFYMDTAEYQRQTQTGISSGYGIEWKVDSTRPPRSFYVAFVEPDSPAQTAGIKRGDKLTAVNNVDFVNDNTQSGVSALNDGLFPSDVGELHVFEFETMEGELVTHELVSADVLSMPVQHVKILDAAVGKVGYMLFNSHIAMAQAQLIDAVQRFQSQGISELVVDLRYNGGGLLALASQLAYMVAGNDAIQNRPFETTQFNGKWQRDEALPFLDEVVDYDRFVTTGQLLPSLHLNRVFVLTTDATCSASESFINALRGVDLEVIQIGGTTCGKPYGFYPEDNCGTTYFTIQFKGVNAKGFGEYADGFSPVEAPVYNADVRGCPLADDLSHDLGDPGEGLLATALSFAQEGSCPVVPAKFDAVVQRSVAESEFNASGKAVRDPRTHFRVRENAIKQPVRQSEAN